MASKENPSQGPSASRRGLTSLARLTPKLTSHVLEGKNTTLIQLQLEWESVVGPALAKYTHPAKLTFSKDAGRKAGLLIHCSPGIAVEIQHMSLQLLNKINMFLGESMVKSLRIKQTPVIKTTTTKKVRPAPRPNAPLPDDIARQIESVEEDTLRTALERLAKAVC